MRQKNSVRILPDNKGNPLYVLMPYEMYQGLLAQPKSSAPHQIRSGKGAAAIPSEVLKRVNQDKVTLVRAWREYLGLTQQQVADRLNVTQGAFALTEKRDNPRPTTLTRIAKAMKLDISQLMP